MADHAGRAVFQAGIDDPRGNAQRGKSVTVYLRGTGTLATLYADRNKTALANPTTTDSAGNIMIYADPGDYDAVINGATLPFTVIPDWADIVTDDEAAGGLPAHLSDAVDAHDASAVSFAPAGTVAATDVQAAIAEVATDAAALVTAEAGTRGTNDSALSARIAVIESLGPLATDAEVAAAIAALSGTYAELIALAGNPDLLIAGVITRDANDAATSAPVVWPNGTVGTYTATTVSSAFPGAVDAYTITYGSPVTRTYTQAAVTRNVNGAVTTRPAITVA